MHFTKPTPEKKKKLLRNNKKHKKHAAPFTFVGHYTYFWHKF